MDDRSKVKTSSVSHFLPFYEEHADSILGIGNLEEKPSKSHADFQKTGKSSGLVMVIGEQRREKKVGQEIMGWV